MEKIYFSAVKEETSPFHVLLAGITYAKPDYGIMREKSDIFVVEYITDGEGTVICEEKSYTVKKGDAYLLPMGKWHKYFSSKSNPWEKKWMNISGLLCERLLSAYNISDTVYFPSAPIEGFFDEFFDFCENNKNGKLVNEYGAIIFHRIVQKLALKTDARADNSASKAKLYIDGTIYGKLTARSVAENVNLSVSQLGRIFKAEYGTTVYSYILMRKLDTAANLLKNTLLSIKEISDMLHFTDEHYFSNIFKRKYNVSPTAYREKSRII